jgi:predicted TPR repeat methyltransferase
MLDDSSEAAAAPPPWSARGSGDMRADRRYAYGREALAEGNAAGAADLARQVLELAPDWPPAWLLLGEAERAAGRALPAIAAFRAALARDAEDRLGAGLHLAALGVGEPGSAMSGAYVATLFDDYAHRFEKHLTLELRYRGPDQIMDLLSRLGAGRGGPSFRRVVDIGCGTGLMGAALAGHAERLAGCDLSPNMVALARGSGFYAEVTSGDGEAFLLGQPEASADLVTASDVLIYVGALDPLFAAVARVLAPGGLFAFTLQTGPDAGFVLGDDMRYRHAPAHAAGAARRNGLIVVAQEDIVIRLDRGVPLPGVVMACRRADT